MLSLPTNLGSFLTKSTTWGSVVGKSPSVTMSQLQRKVKISVYSNALYDNGQLFYIKSVQTYDLKVNSRMYAWLKLHMTEPHLAALDNSQAFKDLIDPVAKVKQPKVQSKQEVKADIPLAETDELQRSISYLERQRDNILAAVAYRNEMARIQYELQVLEAKRQEELDDEAALLLLI